MNNKKIRIITKGDTVYEIDRVTKKPKRIIHGKSEYFTKLYRDTYEADQDYINEKDDYDEDIEEETPVKISSTRRKDILKNVMGNKKKIVTKADGLNKEIAIDDEEHEQKYINPRYDLKYRKKKSKKSTKRINKKPLKKHRGK